MAAEVFYILQRLFQHRNLIIAFIVKIIMKNCKALRIIVQILTLFTEDRGAKRISQVIKMRGCLRGSTFCVIIGIT